MLFARKMFPYSSPNVFGYLDSICFILFLFRILFYVLAAFV